MDDKRHYDWSEIAFSNKKPLKALRATFVVAPLDISPARLTEIIKQYLAHSNLIIGISKESHVVGYEDQLKFKMLNIEATMELVEKVKKRGTKNQLYSLSYSQSDLVHIIEAIKPTKLAVMNGSYKYAFHYSQAFYAANKCKVTIEHISPFIDENEAMVWVSNTNQPDPTIDSDELDDRQLMQLAHEAAKQSYDYCLQVGAVLAEKSKLGYIPLASSFNKVVPEQWWSLHYGSAREKYYAPAQDINHHDTIHAEMKLMIDAATNKLSLRGTTLFLSLLPCPACARVLSETQIDELVYEKDYADGYAVKLFELAGKKVRRVVL